MPNTSNYREQGGASTVVGGVMTVTGEIKVASGGKITAAGTQANHIANIANDADGTAIATAVNAIIAVLEGIGATKTS